MQSETESYQVCTDKVQRNNASPWFVHDNELQVGKHCQINRNSEAQLKGKS